MLEAVLLVGGQGTRLRPLTLTTPKPMLPVAGVPFLTHQIAKLADAGVSHVVLATSYRAEVFAEHFGDGRRLGVELTYVQESEPLGTGGAISNASRGLRSIGDDPVVILNGDVLSCHDLAGQLTRHQEVAADVTLHLVEVEDARAYGCVPTDDNGDVTAFLEKMPDPVTSWVNAGTYVFRRSVIDAIPSGKVVSVERETFPQLLEAGRHLTSWKQTAYWLDVGTPAALVRCSADLVLGVASSSALPGSTGSSLVAPGATVAATARLTAGSSVGADAVIEDESQVLGSIVMAGAVVGRGAVVERSVVGARARVAPGCHLVDAVLADGESAQRSNV